MRRYVRIFVILTLLVVLLLLATTTYAIGSPTNILVPHSYVNRNLLEANDTLFLVHYDIQYTLPYPTDYTVDDSFIFQLLDSTDTLFGTAVAYSYANNGYGEGVVAFYFDGDTTVDWRGDYKIRIAGNPAVFTSPMVKDFSFGYFDWTLLSSQSSNRNQLRNRIITITEDLETEWVADLLENIDVGTVLSADGEEYFDNAITELQSLCPALYYVQTTVISADNRTWNTSYAANLSGSMSDTWVGNSTSAAGDLLGINGKLATSLCIITPLCVLAVWFSASHLRSLWPGYIASVLVIIGGVRLSMVHMGFLAVFVLLSVLLIGWELFFKKA